MTEFMMTSFMIHVISTIFLPKLRWLAKIQ